MMRRSLVLALLVGMAWMAKSEPVRADPSGCAEYISGGTSYSSTPISGWLIGSKKISKTSTWGAGWNPYNFGGSVGGSTTEEYYQGVYALEGGGTITVDCGTYRLI